jgi:vacuole morphology and inheritance protein 14
MAFIMLSLRQAQTCCLLDRSVSILIFITVIDQKLNGVLTFFEMFVSNCESSQIKDHLAKRDYDIIDAIVNQLACLAFNNNPSWRWGGVMGLAACSIALGPEIASYLLAIVPPIISCFSDPDSKVRYFSCEGMYNVVKVAKGEILVYFNDLFDSLSKVGYFQPLCFYLISFFPAMG